jgi:hypothetical protein
MTTTPGLDVDEAARRVRELSERLIEMTKHAAARGGSRKGDEERVGEHAGEHPRGFRSQCVAGLPQHHEGAAEVVPEEDEALPPGLLLAAAQRKRDSAMCAREPSSRVRSSCPMLRNRSARESNGPVVGCEKRVPSRGLPVWVFAHQGHVLVSPREERPHRQGADSGHQFCTCLEGC